MAATAPCRLRSRLECGRGKHRFPAHRCRCQATIVSVHAPAASCGTPAKPPRRAAPRASHAAQPRLVRVAAWSRVSEPAGGRDEAAAPPFAQPPQCTQPPTAQPPPPDTTPQVPPRTHAQTAPRAASPATSGGWHKAASRMVAKRAHRVGRVHARWRCACAHWLPARRRQTLAGPSRTRIALDRRQCKRRWRARCTATEAEAARHYALRAVRRALCAARATQFAGTPDALLWCQRPLDRRAPGLPRASDPRPPHCKRAATCARY